MRARDEFGQPPPPLFIGKGGVEGLKISATSIHVISKIFWSKSPKRWLSKK
jgi:hypothetical protein